MNIAGRIEWPSPLCILGGSIGSKKGQRAVNGGVVAFEGHAWEEALARWRPLLRILAAQSLNPRLWKRVDPSDMVQRTMLEAHQDRAKFRGTTEDELAGWLRAILRHRIIDEARRLKCGKNDMDREIPMERALTESMGRLRTQHRNSSSPSRALDRHEEALRLASALEKLPEDQRRAIELRHLQGRTLAETAEFLARSKPAVAGLLHRAQVTLRELLTNSR